MTKGPRRRSPSRSRYHRKVASWHGWDWKPAARCRHQWNLEETGTPTDDYLFCVVCGRQHPGEEDPPYWAFPLTP